MELAMIFLGILLIPCILFTIINYIYNNYKDVGNKKKLSGFEVARKILDEAGLDNVYIVEVKTNLNDHYDYGHKVLRLSSDIFHGESLTAAVVAAKIASYAIQDKECYSFMKFRFSVNRVITFVNYIAYILFVVALCLGDSSFLDISNLLLMFVLLFYIVTLPVEFNACKAAKKYLNKYDILTNKELEESEKLFKVFPYTSIMSVITCISSLVSEIMYNIQKRG